VKRLTAARRPPAASRSRGRSHKQRYLLNLFFSFCIRFLGFWPSLLSRLLPLLSRCVQQQHHQQQLVFFSFIYAAVPTGEILAVAFNKQLSLSFVQVIAITIALPPVSHPRPSTSTPLVYSVSHLSVSLLLATVCRRIYTGPEHPPTAPNVPDPFSGFLAKV